MDSLWVCHGEALLDLDVGVVSDVEDGLVDLAAEPGEHGAEQRAGGRHRPTRRRVLSLVTIADQSRTNGILRRLAHPENQQ
jgi:hypothetical protein